MGILIERQNMTEGQLEIEQGPSNLKPIAEAASDITWAKKNADLFFLDRTDGRIHSTSEIFGEVKKHSKFFVGQDDQGRRMVFGVVPEARVRQGNEKRRTLEALQAHKYASQMLFLGAVRTALRDGQIDTDLAEKTAAEVIGQMGMRNRVDPDDAIRFLSERKYTDITFARGFDKVAKDSLKGGQPQAETSGDQPQDSHRIGVPNEAIAAVAIAGVEAKRRGSRRVSKLLLVGATGLAVGSLLLDACAPIATPTPIEQKPATPTTAAPGATETQTYSTPDGTNTGAEFPKTIDAIGWTDPYDALHQKMGADVLANTVKADVKADYGDTASASMQFLEVAGQGKGGGMIGVFRDEAHNIDVTMLTVKDDGSLDYLGRSGKQFGYSPLYWRTEADGSRIGFVIGPNGLTDMLKSVDGKVQFKPFGQDNWVAFASAARGKLLADMAPVPSDMVDAMRAGGKIDWKTGLLTDTSGKPVFKMGGNGVWEKVVAPSETAPVQQMKEFKLTDGTILNMPEFSTMQEAIDSLIKSGGITWYTGGLDFNKRMSAINLLAPNTKEFKDFYTPIKNISGGVTPDVGEAVPQRVDKFVTFQVTRVNDGGSVVFYIDAQGNEKSIFIDEDSGEIKNDLEGKSLNVPTPTP